MDRKFTSILEELTNMVPTKDKDLFIDSRAQQVVASAVNLMSLIDENYDEETALDLKRRLFNSIKSGDAKKFRRGVMRAKSDKE
jgi:hypothetical protein